MTTTWTHVEGVPKIEWFRWCLAVGSQPEKFGLSDLRPEKCVGGYCLRHKFNQPVAFTTSDGLRLCRSCATLWAVRVHFNLKHKIEDL